MENEFSLAGYFGRSTSSPTEGRWWAAEAPMAAVKTQGGIQGGGTEPSNPPLTPFENQSMLGRLTKSDALNISAIALEMRWW